MHDSGDIADLVRLSQQRKRAHPGLDVILSDAHLSRAIRGITDVELGDAGPLTLLGCLLSNLPDDAPANQILRALDAGLQRLHRARAIRAPGKLMDRLLNAPQFLHTVSEVAFANTLSEREWAVELDVPFHGSRDVDVFAALRAERRYIDVVNLGERPLASKHVDATTLTVPNHHARTVSRIVSKYQSKFEQALHASWTGPAWVALDITKDDAEFVTAGLHYLARTPWYRDVCALVKGQCPHLAGVIIYAGMPTSSTVQILATADLVGSKELLGASG